MVFWYKIINNKTNSIVINYFKIFNFKIYLIYIKIFKNNIYKEIKFTYDNLQNDILY